MPDKIPPGLMVACPVPLVTDQVPEGLELVNAGLLLPTQTFVAPPKMGPIAGKASMLNDEALLAVPNGVCTTTVPDKAEALLATI